VFLWFLSLHEQRKEPARRRRVEAFALKAKTSKSKNWIDSPHSRLALRAIRYANVRFGLRPKQSACAGMTSRRAKAKDSGLRRNDERKNKELDSS